MKNEIHLLVPNYFLSACKTFDNSANGYVRAEGCGMVVLSKDSSKGAYAIVRGTAINHDGKTATLTAPNGPSQEAVYRAALKDAGLYGSDIDMVECHGTGTPLGDPIEINSLKVVYGGAERKKRLVGGYEAKKK